MGKALYGSLYVHPPLTDSEVSELEALDLGGLSLSVHQERDAMTAWPAFDEGDGDLRTLVAKLRSWSKSTFMNAFVHSDGGGEGEEWVVIGDDIQGYYFGSGSVPEYIKPWLSGDPPRITSRVPLGALQRLTAHALRITEMGGDALLAELRALGQAIPDRQHARALLDELHALACSDFELSKAHWLEWRARRGTIGVMMARIAMPEELDVPKSDFESFNLTEGWLESVPSVADVLPRLIVAARALERRVANDLLVECASNSGVTIPPETKVSRATLDRAAEYYGDYGGFLIRTHGVAGVTKMLPELVAAAREAGDPTIQSMLEWHAFVCREDEGELFAAALEREPELAALADAGKKQCS